MDAAIEYGEEVIGYVRKEAITFFRRRVSMEAAELLRELARATATAPEPPGSGQYHYVHTCGSNIRTSRFLQRDGRSTVTAAVKRFERRQWIAPDGSGRLVVTEGRETVPPSGEYSAGQLMALFITAVDENSLVSELARLNSKNTTAAIVGTISQVWASQVVVPALQRLLLLRLANCVDLAVEDVPREFAGRTGVAVSHVDEVRHVRQLLAFSPETGELIGEEKVALEGAAVAVEVPAVVKSTEWLRTGFCGTTAEPPR